MIKFILDAMYYQIFIFNRDKFILENPHERTIQIICGILFLPVIVLTYLLIEENFNYKTPFVFFIIIYILLLDIGRFEVEAAHRPRNGVGVAGLVATHHPVEVPRVFQGVGGDADFFQVLPVDF